MLEHLQDGPAHALALRASGTVMAHDVESVVEAAIGQSGAATGLVVVIDQDFDGYLAEVARGVSNAALSHKGLVKVAVVTSPNGLSEAEISGFQASPVTVRLFKTGDERTAFEWAAAARRGE
jgi:carbon monoxide dehydrogenase subunit G